MQHDCKTELRDVFLKVTPARLGVLAALEEANTPLDAASIFFYLAKQGIAVDRVTVFRIMQILTEKGLVRSVQFNEGKLRYESNAKEEHHHLICERCGAIEDITDCVIGTLEKEIFAKHHFMVKRHALEFFGVCKQCQR